MGNRIGKIYLSNEVQLEANGGSPMRVNGSKLPGSDLMIVELIDKLLNRHAGDFVNELWSDLFL